VEAVTFAAPLLVSDEARRVTLATPLASVRLVPEGGSKVPNAASVAKVTTAFGTTAPEALVTTTFTKSGLPEVSVFFSTLGFVASNKDRVALLTPVVVVPPPLDPEVDVQPD